MDVTDTRKVDIHIASNHPTVQIFDSNANESQYTPNWSTEPLELIPTVYADSIKVTDSLSSFRWVMIIGNETSETTIPTTNKTLKITGNELSEEVPMIRYKFYAYYNNTEYSNEIIFSFITTGKNGTDGYIPQKGVDYFDGKDGKDGTSVVIKGVAYAKTTPITGSAITLYPSASSTTPITGTSTGESYLVDGYLCVYNANDGKFICTGKIQGPKGEPGDSSYLFVRYASDQNGTDMSASSDGKTYIGFYRSSVDVAPTDPSLITWIKFVGTSASLVSITPSALYFKSTEGKNGTFTPEYIYLYPRFQAVTYANWQYSIDGGVTWNNATGANGLTIGTYNSVANSLRISRTSTLYTDTITSISFRCLSSNNTIYDTVSVTKIYDVVDLKIGGRNLARYTDSENWVNYRSATVSFSDGTRSKRIKAICNTTDTATNAVFGIQQNTASKLMKLKSGQEYTLSFLIRGNIPNLNYTYLMNEGTTNQNIQGIDAKSISETNFTKITKTFTANSYADLSTGSYLMISTVGPTDPSLWFEIEEVQLEVGQIATDWMPSPEDILDSAANVNVMLSNEAHFFEADSQGVPTATSIVLDVVGFKGSVPSTTKVGTISGLPSTGMTATISNNETTNTKITVAITTALTSSIADYGTLTIPITVNGHTINKTFSWSKAKAGVAGKGVTSIIEQYYQSTSATTQSDGSWVSTVPAWVDGKYMWTRSVITYTDATTYTTSPICVTGQKGGTGGAGVGISSVDVWYYQSTSATALSGGSWSTTAPTWSDGKYIWTKTITTYTNGTTDETSAVCITGQKGSQGVAAVSFQVYAPNGYLLTNELESLTLQTLAYEGSTAITSGATYQWSQLIDDVWTTISEATSMTYTVTRADVLKAKSYRCVMTYKNQTYTSTVTVQDKTDIYNSIMCISSNATNNDCYWVLYTLVYSDTEEVDPLLGPISINAPSSPESGDYWYAVDSTNATVTLKKYDGTNWADSTDTQSLSYYWDMINDGSAQIPLGDSAKVKVISCHDFTSTATLVCEVSNLEDGLLTQASLSLTDASDPIVSDTEPIATVNGQIWIKPNDNGTYLMFVWDESVPGWISSDMDTRSKVYTSRPSSYNAGDLWITASDTDHGSYLQGTLLQAQNYNIEYNASDWSPTLRYDKDLDNMKETLNNLSQYVTITSSGLRIAARDSSGNLSPFTSLFTSTALTFYQGSDKLLTLANNQLTAPKIVVENELEVQGEIKLGDLKLIIESNGSFSFAVQK